MSGLIGLLALLGSIGLVLGVLVVGRLRLLRGRLTRLAPLVGLSLDARGGRARGEDRGVEFELALSRMPGRPFVVRDGPGWPARSHNELDEASIFVDPNQDAILVATATLPNPLPLRFRRRAPSGTSVRHRTSSPAATCSSMRGSRSGVRRTRFGRCSTHVSERPSTTSPAATVDSTGGGSR